MATEIVMPRLSDSMEEGTILRWFVSEGDAVREGEALVEVQTDTASVTYDAEQDGTVLSIGAASGESVAVGAVIAVVEDAPPSPVATAAGHGAPPAGNGHAASGTAKGHATRHDLSRLQQTIARRMAESRATVPDFELRCQVDMSRAVALREVTEPTPSYNDLLVAATARALREFPRVNGSYRDGSLEEYSRVNVGITVAAADALLVPTIFDADRLSLTEIGAVARALAAKVRDGTISPAELGGSTFSISNLGMYGVDGFSAVINPPQAAILAVGALRPRAIIDKAGAVVARPTIELTLACDHRILYGADGARFLARVRELLERPLALLA